MNYLGKIAACTAAVMLAISIPSFGDWSPTGQAHAGNGNGAGNGGGSGNSGGNGAGNGSNAGGSSPSGNSTNTRTQSRTPTGTQQKSTTRTQTRTPTALEVMNAANASPISRMFAPPNSAVGKVATYDRARTAALALTDPVAQEEALTNAVAQLQAGLALPLTAAELNQLNAILDAN